MNKFITIIAISMLHFAVTQIVFTQITINVPRIPKIGKPNSGNGRDGVDTTKKDDGSANTNTDTNGKGNGKANGGTDNLYTTTRPTGTPMFMKSTVHVQAKTHNEYWKMKGQRNFSSWVPLIRFSHFYNNDVELNYTVDYINPDGTAWYSEKLESSGRNANRTVVYQSPSPWGGILDTKSTNATGTFSFKITNDDTKEVLYQGKFKVGKFSTSNGGPDKNKFEFFVDHDWLMPFGMIGFHFAGVEIGGIPPLVYVWIKGAAETADLEARIFYKGQQLASTKDGGGATSVEERMSDAAPAFAPLNRWRQFQFQWRNILFDNNGTFNRANYPNAFYLDKNPGVYTVKIYDKGTQIRELEFTIGSDGRFVRPAYSDQVFMPYHAIFLPVKVTAPDEKWNAAAWKTDAFYGNPLTGFSAQ